MNYNSKILTLDDLSCQGQIVSAVLNMSHHGQADVGLDLVWSLCSVVKHNIHRILKLVARCEHKNHQSITVRAFDNYLHGNYMDHGFNV